MSDYSAEAAALLADIADRLYANEPDWKFIDKLRVVLRPSPDPQELLHYMEPAEPAPDMMKKIREAMKESEERRIRESARISYRGEPISELTRSIYGPEIMRQLTDSIPTSQQIASHTANPATWTYSINRRSGKN